MKRMLLFLLLLTGFASAQTVTIYRANGNLRSNSIFSCDHSGYKLPVKEDGRVIAKVKRGRYLTVNVTPGKHTFQAGSKETVEVDAEPGHSYFLRPYQGCGGIIHADFWIEKSKCEDAVLVAHELKPVDPKDIKISPPELNASYYFSQSCTATVAKR